MDERDVEDRAGGGDDEVLGRARSGDRGAVEELVRRYAPMVVAAARRQLAMGGVDGTAAAEDVAQQVFVVMVGRLGRIGSGGALAGWLMGATRNHCRNWLKVERRRRHHERRAAMERPETADGDEARELWERVWPAVDEAVARMPPADREALLLRYFRGLSLRETGASLGVTEEGARKRVGRAVERLREGLIRQGVVTPAVGAGVLGAVLEVHAGGTAAAGTLAGGGTAGIATAVGKSVGATGGVAAQGTGGLTWMGAIMASQAAKAGILVVVLAAASAGSFLAVRPSGGGPAAPGVSAAGWEEGFRTKYGLPDGSAVRYVPRPFGDERAGFVRRMFAEGVAAAGAEPAAMALTQKADGTFGFSEVVWGDAKDAPKLRWVLRQVAGVAPGRAEGAPELLDAVVPGDWVVQARDVRAMSSGERAAVLSELQPLLAEAMGKPVRLTSTVERRATIEVSGEVRAEVQQGQFRLSVPPRTGRPPWAVSDEAERSVHWLGEALGKPVVAEGARGKLSMILVETPGATEASAMADLAATTGLTVRTGTAEVEVVRVEAGQADAWVPTMRRVYGLKAGEVAKRVAPPFVPERLAFYRATNPGQAEAIPAGPDVMMLKDDGTSFESSGIQFGGGKGKGAPLAMRQVVEWALPLKPWEYRIAPDLATKRLTGDWVWRNGVGTEELLKAVATEFRGPTAGPVVIEQRPTEVDCIVFRGAARATPELVRIKIPVSQATRDRYQVGGGGSIVYLYVQLGYAIDAGFIDEAERTTANLNVSFTSEVVPLEPGDDDAARAARAISEATGLTWTREKRVIPVWYVK